MIFIRFGSVSYNKRLDLGMECFADDELLLRFSFLCPRILHYETRHTTYPCRTGA